MVLVSRVRKRGASLVVVADGELLFAPQGPGAQLNRRMSNRIRAFAAQEAPANKRPRWAHYGPPLKSTMRASTRAEPAAMRAISVVGSTAPHSGYVDQGTGIYAGRGAYEAKILPPWTRGGASLYEHTWRPGPGQSRVAPVVIKGQKGQGFFDKALRRAFAAERIASAEVPGTGGAGLTRAITTVPDELLGFLGNTIADASFVAQLEQWRAWRDARWRAGFLLGEDNTARRTRLSRSTRSYTRPSPERRRAQAAKRAREYRARNKAKGLEKPRVRKPRAKKPVDIRAAQIQRARERFLMRVIGRYPAADGYLVSDIAFTNGHWQAIVTSPRGESHTVRDKNRV